MHERDVIKTYDKWTKVKPSMELLEGAIAFLEEQKKYLEENSMGKEGDAADQQTPEKIGSYLAVLRGINQDEEAARKLMLEVESRVVGLFQSWREAPSDKSIPPVLENYVYLRCVLEIKAGYVLSGLSV